MKLIKCFDKVILTLLGFVGLLSACETVAEYGTPNADFVIKGTITDSISSSKVPNIRVIRTDVNNPTRKDTIYSDSKGNYQFTFNSFAYEKPEFDIKVEDIDGSLNGGEFIAQQARISIINTDWVNSGDDDWYYGKAIKTRDFKLLKK